jgi:hypothetical protein
MRKILYLCRELCNYHNEENLINRIGYLQCIARWLQERRAIKATGWGDWVNMNQQEPTSNPCGQVL